VTVLHVAVSKLLEVKAEKFKGGRGRAQPDKLGPCMRAFTNAIWANAFSGEFFSLVCPRVVASSNPGRKLANAFGVSSN
jgi:hypothetical protein